MGYGTPAAIQEGGVYALEHAAELTPPIANTYLARRDAVVEGFRALGWNIDPSPATMFAWIPLPRGYSAQEFTVHLIEQAGVVVTPGNAFGPGGEGFFRLSLVAEPEVLRDAIARIGAALGPAHR